MAQIPDSLAKKIEGFCENRTVAHEILGKTSDIYRQIVDLNNKFLMTSQREGGLGQKEKVMVLLGIHATQGTEQGIHFAVNAAMQAGATDGEIMDSLDLALLTGGGGAVARVQFAASVLEYYRAQERVGAKKVVFDFAAAMAKGS